jgi:hypothetical protein
VFRKIPETNVEGTTIWDVARWVQYQKVCIARDYKIGFAVQSQFEKVVVGPIAAGDDPLVYADQLGGGASVETASRRSAGIRISVCKAL